MKSTDFLMLFCAIAGIAVAVIGKHLEESSDLLWGSIGIFAMWVLLRLGFLDVLFR